MPESEGGVAVGRVARIASRVAAFISRGAVAGVDNGEPKALAEGGVSGDAGRDARCAGGCTSDEEGTNSPS